MFDADTGYCTSKENNNIFLNLSTERGDAHKNVKSGFISRQKLKRHFVFGKKYKNTL